LTTPPPPPPLPPLQVSRWTKKEQYGYIYNDYSLSGQQGLQTLQETGGSSSSSSMAPRSGPKPSPVSLNALKKTMSLKGLGGRSASSAAAEPRIVLEIEFLPYW